MNGCAKQGRAFRILPVGVWGLTAPAAGSHRTRAMGPFQGKALAFLTLQNL